jgi:hypothetical protein
MPPASMEAPRSPRTFHFAMIGADAGSTSRGSGADTPLAVATSWPWQWWSVVVLIHLAVVALSWSSLRATLSGAASQQFVLSRTIGAAAYVACAWVLLRAFDWRASRTWPRVVRWLLGGAIIAGTATLNLVVGAPLLLAVERIAGMPTARSLEDFTSTWEIALVYYAGWAFAWRVRHTRLAVIATEARAAAADSTARLARLHALTLELQPHFLFNTLNGIVHLVSEAPADAERMLIALADLLRNTLHAGSRAEIPLREERAMLEQYLALQRMRHGTRVQMHVGIDASVSAAYVPPLLLQPIVENALSHGVAHKPGEACVVIAAARAADAPDLLELTVTDDGAGYDAATTRDGTGLRNTRERLAVLYAQRASLALVSRPGGGTIVTIRLPLRTVSAS